MKLFRVIVPVDDVEAATTFYGAVFGTAGERVSGNRHYFDAGGDTWVAAGGALEDDISRRDWGEDSFYGRDPWGNRIVFVAAGTEFTGGRFVP